MYRGTMRKYEWSEYYENFYFMDERYQVKDVFKLKSLGPSDEVYKIISELSKHKKAANRLLRMAVEQRLIFSGDQLVGIIDVCPNTLALQAVYNSVSELKDEDMEKLREYIGEIHTLYICRTYGKALPECMKDAYEPPYKVDKNGFLCYKNGRLVGFETALVIKQQVDTNINYEDSSKSSWGYEPKTPRKKEGLGFWRTLFGGYVAYKLLNNIFGGDKK